MVGFRKKSQDSVSFSRSSGARGDGRAGAASSGAAQRARTGRNEPVARAGKGRRGPAAGRRGYTTSDQMDSRCLTLAESASSVLGRSLDQALGRLPDGPGAPGASRGTADPVGPAGGNWSDAVGASGSTRARGASAGSVRSAQVGTGQVDTIADIASDIEF